MHRRREATGRRASGALSSGSTGARRICRSKHVPTASGTTAAHRFVYLAAHRLVDSNDGASRSAAGAVRGRRPWEPQGFKRRTCPRQAFPVRGGPVDRAGRLRDGFRPIFHLGRPGRLPRGSGPRAAAGLWLCPAAGAVLLGRIWYVVDRHLPRLCRPCGPGRQMGGDPAQGETAPAVGRGVTVLRLGLRLATGPSGSPGPERDGLPHQEGRQQHGCSEDDRPEQHHRQSEEHRRGDRIGRRRQRRYVVEVARALDDHGGPPGRWRARRDAGVRAIGGEGEVVGVGVIYIDCVYGQGHDEHKDRRVYLSIRGPPRWSMTCGAPKIHC